MVPDKITVSIFGSEYTLVSDQNEEYVKKIAEFVDQKMREIDRSQNISSTAKIAILTALNIADELNQEREYRKKLTNQINEEARKMNQSLMELLEE